MSSAAMFWFGAFPMIGAHDPVTVPMVIFSHKTNARGCVNKTRARESDKYKSEKSRKNLSHAGVKRAIYGMVRD